MGWNQGYTIMEQTVIGAYDLGVLDKKLLGVLLEPYRDTDIDSGGSEDRTTKKGAMDVREVVVLVATGKPFPGKPAKKWNEANRDEWDAYDENLYEAFRKVTKKYGW